MQLERLNTWETTNRRVDYNEFILPSSWWSTLLPGTIEAIFGAKTTHAAFLQQYGLTAETHPYVEIDLSDWENPIRAG